YLKGLALYPNDNLFRERLMWLYVDQGRTADLKPLLTTWKARARQDRTLWLPFASASQMLGRGNEALAWYRMYLKKNPDDWLGQAAYADALQGAGYLDMAQRVRFRLLRSLQSEQVKPASQHSAVWLRLMASSYSPRMAEQKALQWQDGSPAM